MIASPPWPRCWKSSKPCGLLVGSTQRGRAVAGRLAARLGVTALTDVLAVPSEAGGIQARHMIFGGGAVRVERPLSETVLATVGPGIFEPRPAEAGRGGEIIEVPLVEPRLARHPARAQTPPGGLGQPGRREKSGLLRARAGPAGRPGPGERAGPRCWGPRWPAPARWPKGWTGCPASATSASRGPLIKPDLYLGVGVSGQVQHTDRDERLARGGGDQQRQKCAHLSTGRLRHRRRSVRGRPGADRRH